MNNKYNLPIGIIIFVIILGVSSYFWIKKAIPPFASTTPTPSQSPTPSPTITPPKEVWETYNNDELGFSIQYPQMVYGIYRCEPQEIIYTPLKVYEDNKNGIVYITEDYYYDNWDNQTQSNTGSCKKITHSLESLNKDRENIIDINDKVHKNANPFLTKVFIIKSVKSDFELNEFIKDNYGSGCLVKEKKSWLQNRVYDIEIKGEDWNKGADLGTTTCPFNNAYKILYSPEKNKVMSVNLGQECGFGLRPSDSMEDPQCYDKKMIDSFRFK